MAVLLEQLFHPATQAAHSACAGATAGLCSQQPTPQFRGLQAGKVSCKGIVRSIEKVMPFIEDVAERYAPLIRSEEHTSELQSRPHLVCRLLLEKKKKKK